MQINGAPETEEEWIKYYLELITSGKGMTTLQYRSLRRLLDKKFDPQRGQR